MIQLYTAGTPNGYKASIMLEACELPYNVNALNLGEKDQKQDWFLKINPNGRIPAIVDEDEDNFAVFESGAILLYLAEKCGRFLGNNAKERSQAVQWTMFQMGGIGPMQGQLHVFLRYAPEKIPFAIDRYRNETLRLYGVLNERLKDRPFLVADEPTIADFANYPWVRGHGYSELNIDHLEHLGAWLQRLDAMPAVQRGLAVPNKPPSDPNQVAEIGKKII